MAKIVSLTGFCSAKKVRVGYQFVNENQNKLIAKASFKFFGEDSASSTSNEVNGEFYTDSSFKCVCGNGYLYQCVKCKTLVCYDGDAKTNIKCPNCSAVSNVPKTGSDRRIVSSGNAVSNPDIVLAIDISGSMYGRRLDTVKRAAINQFISKYHGKSRMALVSFATTVKVEERLTANLQNIEHTIREFTAYGGTISPLDTVLSAYELTDFRNSPNKKYLVVFTDGEWSGDRRYNVGRADQIKKMGITILTVGCDSADKGFLDEISSPNGAIVTNDSGIGNAFAEIAKKTAQ